MYQWFMFLLKCKLQIQNKEQQRASNRFNDCQILGGFIKLKIKCILKEAEVNKSRS